VEDDAARRQMQTALAKWHAPQAAEQIAETMLKLIAQETEPARATPPAAQGGRGEHRAEWRAKTTA
jgi:hypothetical protein